jgi:DNA-binding CsgD family transcriptional regulator
MKIDTTLWESKVYLTHITTFDTMYMVSRDLIIAETDINTDGHFSFSTSFFPEDEQLYRLHIVKKNDPATSLSIGGIDENHIFVIASRSKGVFLESFSGEFPFSSINVTGSVNSVDFQRINITASYKDSTIIDGQVVKPEFISKTIDERLRLMADSLSSPITATYALYRTNFERYVLEQPDYFARHISKWDKGSLSYISHFKEKLNLPQKKSSIQWWQIIISSILFFVLGAAFSKWRVKKIHPSVDKLSLLSVQERRVFELIKRGSSNKEIAQEFNIGISTVKSHVSNIYAKLDIKSRTQAMNFKS